MKNILVLCTGNSCRSQIAHGYLEHFTDKKDNYLLDFNSKISFTNVVSKPTLPDKKCFPIRWVIVTVSSLSAFALACLFFIITNKAIRKVD